MDADEAIAEVIAVEGGRLLRLAFQLSHDRWIAEDLVQQALENVYRRWRRSPVDDVSNREAYARKAVVNEFLRRRRLRAATEIVTDRVPDAEGFTFQVPGRTALLRRRWVASTAAAACVAVVAAAVAVASNGAPQHPTGARPPSGTTSMQIADTSLAPCPAKDSVRSTVRLTAGDLPQPVIGFDPAAQLVPDTSPQRGVVCFYSHTDHGRLTGSRVLSAAGLPALAGLSWSSRLVLGPCLANLAATDGDFYLVGLSYRSARAWLLVPGMHCAASSNGTFSAGNLRVSADSAYRTGAWPDPADDDRTSCIAHSGRLGQEKQMVPGTPISLTVCRNSSTGVMVSALDAERIRSALNGLGTAPAQGIFGCGRRGSPTTLYGLIFRYSAGPSVDVTVPEGCRPAVFNGSLQAGDGGAVVALIRAALAGSGH